MATIKKTVNWDRLQHYCVSSIGGFLGAYSLLNCHEVLGNAQTANMILFVHSILGGDLKSFLVRLVAILVYVSGFFFSIWIPKYTKLNIEVFSLIVDAICIVSLAVIPLGGNDLVYLYPVFFAMAIQWNTFKSADGYTSSTIFSTNNLKQATTSLMEYFMDGDAKSLDKSKFFGGTLLGFHLGVAVSYTSYIFLGMMGIWLAIVPLLISSLVLCKRLSLKQSQNVEVELETETEDYKLA